MIEVRNKYPCINYAPPPSGKGIPPLSKKITSYFVKFREIEGRGGGNMINVKC